MVSDMNRDDDEVVVIYLLGSILNRTTADIELPEKVIKSHIVYYLIYIFSQISCLGFHWCG